MKRLIATALVAAMSLTTIAATPASALDQGERNRLVIGLGALAVLGALASKSNGNGYVGRDDRTWTPVPEPRRDWRHDRRNRHDRDYGRALPSSCEFNIRTRNGTQQVLGKSCLASTTRIGRLPDVCEFNIRTRSGPRDVYGSDCLERKGYRIVASR